MVLEVWKTCTTPAYQAQRPHDDNRETLIHLQLGEIMILRGDVVHAGGFQTAKNGNPRGHLYLYKRKSQRCPPEHSNSNSNSNNDQQTVTVQGVPHGDPPRSSYRLPNSRVMLQEYYHHTDEAYNKGRFLVSSKRSNHTIPFVRRSLSDYLEERQTEVLDESLPIPVW